MIKTFGIGSFLAGACLLAKPYIPEREWKPEYVIDLAPLTRYDAEGFEKASGFNRWGVDREGNYRDGGSFSGAIIEGKKEGWGNWITPTGETFTGRFDGDRLEGLGLQRTAGGERFYGGFVAGEKDGAGVRLAMMASGV